MQSSTLSRENVPSGTSRLKVLRQGSGQFLQHLQRGTRNDRLGPYWFINENFRLSFFKGSWRKRTNEGDGSLGTTLVGWESWDRRSWAEGRRKAGSCSESAAAAPAKGQSLPAEPRPEGSSETQSAGGPPREAAGSQEKGWEASPGFVGKENSGREVVTSCQRKEIVVILATGHENTSHLRIDLLYECAGWLKPYLNITWHSHKSWLLIHWCFCYSMLNCLRKSRKALDLGRWTVAANKAFLRSMKETWGKDPFSLAFSDYGKVKSHC